LSYFAPEDETKNYSVSRISFCSTRNN